MFKHFLITRFNLRKENWSTNKNNMAVLTEEWHKNRFELFTNYCFASIANQTNKNFEWLVFFDISTPEIYKKSIGFLQKEISNFKPLYINGMSQFLPAVKEHISKYTEDYIISSTIDNDDCLSKNYIEEVQKKFNKQDFMAIDFIDGYTLQIWPNFKLGKKLHQYNPFISLIEKNSDPKTVCAISHRLWKKENRILQIKNTRVWSSVIHKENKVNEFTGFGKVNETIFFKNFIISEEKKKLIQEQLIPQKKWLVSSAFNYLISNWNVVFKDFKKRLGFYKGN